MKHSVVSRFAARAYTQTLHAAMIAEDVPARFARWNGFNSNLTLRLRLAFAKN